MIKVFTLCIVLSLSFLSCSWSEPKQEDTAEELAEEGMEAFDARSYRVAIEIFHRLRDWYPFSEHATLAELKIADSYYHLRRYDRAISAYDAFEGLHPGSEAMPYVIHQIGLSYFRRLDAANRDQTSAKKALETFERLIRLYPDSPYAREAEKNAIECRKSLAGHELVVGVFYFKSKRYSAALRRFRGIVTNYPDVVTIRDQALQYIERSESALRAR